MMDAEDRLLLSQLLTLCVVLGAVLLYAAAVLGLAVLVFRLIGGI